MSPTSITLATATNPRFQWLDSFESLGDAEIEEIILLLRGAQASCYAELARRREPYNDERTYDDTLQNTAKRINKIGFTKDHEDILNKVNVYLADPGDAQREHNENKAVRQYLRLVSIVTSWPYALLILCAVGKWKLGKLRDDQRIEILRYVAKNRGDLLCPRLKEKAVEFKLDDIRIKVEPPRTLGCKKRRRNRGNSEDATTGRKFVKGHRKNPISSANNQIEPNTLFEFASQHTLHRSTMAPEPGKCDGQPPELTLGSGEYPPPPPADVGHTGFFRISGPVQNVGYRRFSIQGDLRVIDALSLEDNFNRNSIPVCQRPYGSPIFMRVLEGDICGVYNILLHRQGSLWDYDPYGLGILYYAAHYCWRGSGEEKAMNMYSSLLEFGAQEEGFQYRTDELGNQPSETINDWLLASQARGQSTGACGQVYEEHASVRGFTRLHEVLLKIDSTYTSTNDYLMSLKPEEITTIIDMPDARGRTPLAWAVEYGLTASTELLLSFGANPHQLRKTKDGGFSPLIHLAIAGPRSSWMDDDIVETVRLLLEAGADINGRDHEGWTALHIASSWSLARITKVLYECHGQCLAWDARTHKGENHFDLCDNDDYKENFLSNIVMCLI